ncbi:MAG: glycosyltransferase [Candidatus Electrothrix sp. AW3_4]|nr:glycosyltransferase [Candidatus Electrothrix gigas]
MLFLPEGEGRRGEGGLRTQEYFKRSLPEKPLITVITVVFNGAQHLEETILSVIRQTYDNVEYIIIDGGSTDGTLDIIRKYEHAIDYWVSEKDEGIYDAMNKGIDLTTGDWINFMNAGDSFFSKNILAESQLDNSFDVIFGDHASYTTDKKIYCKHNARKSFWKGCVPYCHQSLFVKRELVLQFPFNLKYKVAADYNQYIQFKSFGAKIVHISKTISLVLEGGFSFVERKDLLSENYKIMCSYSRIYANCIFLLLRIKKLIQ